MSDVEPPTLREYAVQSIQPRLARMLSHLDGAKKGDETEPIKQMRVWSRRTRAALEVFHDCFDDKGFRRLEREIKTVTGALGTARDLDVMIENLTQREAGLPPNQRSGIASFIANLQEEREAAQQAVRATVGDLENQDLMAQFEAVADSPPPKSKHKGRRRHG